MSDFTSPAVQAMNLIRYIGDEVSRIRPTRCRKLFGDISGIIGSSSEELAESDRRGIVVTERGRS